ncbi:hypothetical protein M7I_5255 [Glarea lozoyensis 74030]|uniref:Uncharacterized protein n=1 Tax=Glarea lozoyensis (strain ATCC 74030 / MF5533) TaxID=1104152 RepID=H0ERD6_GLAL7|nr:hypothetical protein M7I_5255 [Glarea lozoyensis 74030]
MLNSEKHKELFIKYEAILDEHCSSKANNWDKKSIVIRD